jgi:hypothetical protein
MPLPNLHIDDICKCISMQIAAFSEKCKFAWIVEGLKLKQIV